MLRLTQSAWTPTARWHVGDLAWERRLHGGPAEEWPTRLWMDDDDAPLAWGWIAPPNYFELVVAPPVDETLALEVIDWAVATVGADAPMTTTVTLAQVELRAAFERRAFVGTDAPGFHYLACVPTDVVDAPLAAGFGLRAVREDEAELVARTEVHVDAWASTTMTEEVYRRLQATWPYRCDLDVVAEVLAATGTGPRFAASCLAWWDDEHAVGELEPVGTRPAFRRRGLAAAVCSEAVRRLGALGATRAIVYASADPERPGPLALYRSIGFEKVTGTIDLRRN
jgi:ribosomal protein S18 acetylase RimI-like enzyme